MVPSLLPGCLCERGKIESEAPPEPPDRDLHPPTETYIRPTETNTPPYWHLVSATEAGGTHPIGMYSRFFFDRSVNKVEKYVVWQSENSTKMNCHN